MDLDSDRRNVAVNMYGYALNALTNDTNNQNTGCIENRKGNKLISFQLPNGRNKVIGAGKDIKNGAILYMVFNDQNMHSILRYNIGPKTIDKIVYSNPYLNFQEDYKISHINIIGDLLYWTDGYFSKFTYDPSAGEFKDIGFNGPRKINMVKAYNMTNNVNVPARDKYQQITEQVLDRIKYPPYKQPLAEYGSDITKNFNYLIGNLFQFAYSYAYDDKEVSVLSPISDVPIPLNQELVDGTYSLLQPAQNNVINITFNTGDQTVSQIKLFVRRLNVGDWYLLDTVDKYNTAGTAIVQNNVDYNYSLSNSLGFYNNEILLPQDQVELSRPFDFIGQTVDSQEIISDNRVVDGGIVENYDNVDIEVSLSAQYSDAEFANTVNTAPGVQSPWLPATPPSWWTGNSSDLGWEGQMIDFTLPPYSNGDLIQIVITVTVPITVNSALLIDGYVTTHSFSTIVFPSDTPQAIIARLSSMIAGSIYQKDQILPLAGVLRYIAAWESYIIFIPHPVYSAPLSMVANINVIKSSPLIYSFKEGFAHYFSVGYSDRAGRNGALNKSKESKIYIPFITEVGGYQDISTSIKKANIISWEIFNRPPEWATHYQWFYAKQTPKFVQYYYTESNLDALGNIRIKLNEKLVTLVQSKPKSKLEAYTFTDGDRIRFIATGKYSTPNQWWYFPKFIDCEIVGFDVTTGEVIIEDVGFSTSRIQIPTNWDYNIIEIYSPRKIDDESKYYAIGDKLPIYMPHTESRGHIGMDGVHQEYVENYVDIPILAIQTVPTTGIFYQIHLYIDPSYLQQYHYLLSANHIITIDGTWSYNIYWLNGQYSILETFPFVGPYGEIVLLEENYIPLVFEPGGFIRLSNSIPAKGTFTQGDVYVKGRFAVEPPLIPVESDRLSDYYPSNAISIGHPSAVVPDMKRQKYSFLRHSGKYLEDTRINNLSRFLFLDKENVSNEFGDIKAVRQLGQTFKVLQPRKVTSFGIGFQELYTATGSEIPVASSSKILGNMRPSSTGYGCSNPESVVLSNRFMYFYDINSGCVIRDDANGMDPISDRLTKTWFRAKRLQLLDADKYFVISSVNDKKEVIFTFISYKKNPFMGEQVVSVDTIVYNEDTNLWTTFLSYHVIGENGITTPPDYYGGLGETMVSFMNGQLYLEGENTQFNNFFGVQYTMEVEVIDNTDFEKEKIFTSLALATNSNTGSWDVPTITVPSTDKNPIGQTSRINSFTEKEEGLYADTKRDINSKMRGTQKYKLINGDRLRGQACIYRLRNTDTGQVALYSVIFRNISSEISK